MKRIIVVLSVFIILSFSIYADGEKSLWGANNGGISGWFQSDPDGTNKYIQYYLFSNRVPEDNYTLHYGMFGIEDKELGGTAVLTFKYKIDKGQLIIIKESIEYTLSDGTKKTTQLFDETVSSKISIEITETYSLLIVDNVQFLLNTAIAD